MEDAHIAVPNLLPDGSLFAVLDGHGGSEVAQYVSDRLPNIIQQSPYIKAKKWEEAMEQAFRTMDTTIMSESGHKDLYEYYKKATHDDYDLKETELPYHVGCTAVLALITNGEIIVANAGDSRCVMGRKNETVELSEDHKPSNEIELQRIAHANGFVKDDRINGSLNLSRSLGDFHYKSNKLLDPYEQLVISLPDVRIVKLTNDIDFIVLACDGIWENLSSKQVVDFVYTKLKANPQIALSLIIEALFDKIISPDSFTAPLGCDNMSCIIVQFKK